MHWAPGAHLAYWMARKVLVEEPYIWVILDAALTTSSLVLYWFSVNMTCGSTPYCMTLTWEEDQRFQSNPKPGLRRVIAESQPSPGRLYLRARGPDVERRYQFLKKLVHWLPGIDAVGTVQYDHDIHWPPACCKPIRRVRRTVLLFCHWALHHRLIAFTQSSNKTALATNSFQK